ncbi:MAG TPA: hypothetical protein VIH99_00060 [Bdellovibrionota bacterium]
MSKRGYFLLGLGLPLLVLAMLFYFRPFWGLMDDGVNVFLVEKMRSEGIFRIWWDMSMYDIFQQGRMRLMYFLMVPVIYMPAAGSSVVAFAINIVWVCLTFAFVAAASWPSLSYAYGLKNKAFAVFLFFVLCFAYPWTMHAFRAPSVHEKLVIFFAGLVLAAQYSKFASRSLPHWLGVMVPSLVLALNTKEQIALYFPIFLAAQVHVDSQKKNYRRTALLLFLLLASAGVIKWVGTHGTYKSAYGLERAKITLRNSKSLYLFLALAFSAQAAAFVDFLKHRKWPRLLLASSYPAGLVLFVLLMLPWGMGGYLNCAATIFVVACAIALGKFARTHWRAFGRLPLKFLGASAYGLAVLVTVVTVAPDLSAYADLRRIFESREIEEVAASGKTLWMPCSEGAGTMQTYWKEFRGVDLKVRVPADPSSMRAGEYWLGSFPRCTNGEDFAQWVAKGEAVAMVAPAAKGGFMLLKRGTK